MKLCAVQSALTYSGMLLDRLPSSYGVEMLALLMVVLMPRGGWIKTWQCNIQVPGYPPESNIPVSCGPTRMESRFNGLPELNWPTILWPGARRPDRRSFGKGVLVAGASGRRPSWMGVLGGGRQQRR